MLLRKLSSTLLPWPGSIVRNNSTEGSRSTGATLDLSEVKTMLKWISLFVGSCSLIFANSATEDIQALVVKETLTDRKVTVLRLGFHFVTTIQLPEAINSIAIGDPGLFKVE